MANRCPACGGTLQFDVKSQKLICPYCGSSYLPSEIENLQGAQETASSEVYGLDPGVPEDEPETQDTMVFTCNQ